jgi:hypothetical protein
MLTGGGQEESDMAGDPEARFGSKTQTRQGPKSLAQKYSLIAGVFYVAPVVIGFLWGVSAAVPT